MKKKTNPILVETIIKLKKTNPEVAKLLAIPRRKQISVNLEDLEKKSGDNPNVLIPGKILGFGNLNKKLKVVAFSGSKNAIEKIKLKKGEFVLISEEIQKNPQLKDLMLIK